MLSGPGCLPLCGHHFRAGLFTRSLPEWKISSASVKIPSKTENPLPDSTNWPIKLYFICGRQSTKGRRKKKEKLPCDITALTVQASNSCLCAFEHSALSVAALAELLSDLNRKLFDVVVVKFLSIQEAFFCNRDLSADYIKYHKKMQ